MLGKDSFCLGHRHAGVVADTLEECLGAGRICDVNFVPEVAKIDEGQHQKAARPPAGTA